jgi:hypothetical protein
MSTLPRDWAALEARLDKWTPPQGAFEPAGEWTVEYARHSLIPSPDGTPGGGRAGSLSLQHLTGAGARMLKIVETVVAGSSEMTTDADITCGPAPLLTPQRWSLRVRWKTGTPVADGELDQDRSGRVDGQEIVLTGTKERRMPAPARWTSSWSLFAVIPTLPFDTRAAVEFDMFEDLDLQKPGQRVEYLGEQAVEAGDWSRKLHVFEQTGRGILPWRWWLDANHRVLLAAGGRRAYLLDRAAKGGTS